MKPEKLSPWMTLTARNQAGSKVYKIDIDGVIGWQPYDAPEHQANSKNAMKSELKRLANLKADEIIININSPGGNFYHAITIHDLLAENSAKITTKINGMAASAATLIAQTAAPGNRQISDNALYLIHYAWDFEIGNRFAMQTKVNDLTKLDALALKIYTKRTGTSEEKLTAEMDKANGVGEWMNAADAKALGLVDEIFEPMSAAACAEIPAQMSKYFPSLPQNSASESEPEANKLVSALMKFFKNNTNQKEDSEEMNEEQMNKFLDAQNKTTESIANLTKAIEAQMKKPDDTQTPAANNNADNKDADLKQLLDAQNKSTEAMTSLTESINAFMKQDSSSTTQFGKNTGGNEDMTFL